MPEAFAPQLSIEEAAARLLDYVEGVWKLRRPPLLVSITGGAKDLRMDADRENVLFNLIEAARRTDAWLVTAGTNKGLMKYVGRCSQCRCAPGDRQPLWLVVWGGIPASLSNPWALSHGCTDLYPQWVRRTTL